MVVMWFTWTSIKQMKTNAEVSEKEIKIVFEDSWSLLLEPAVICVLEEKAVQSLFVSTLDAMKWI